MMTTRELLELETEAPDQPIGRAWAEAVTAELEAAKQWADAITALNTTLVETCERLQGTVGLLLTRIEAMERATR
jgi:hypothetical protein